MVLDKSGAFGGVKKIVEHGGVHAGGRENEMSKVRETEQIISFR